MVAPGLAEAVAGDLTGDADSIYGSAEDTPRLDAGDRLLISATVREDVLSPTTRIVESESLNSLRIKGDSFLLAGFMLGEMDVLIELTVAFVIDIAPAESQEVADPQGSASSEDDQDVVAILAANQKVICEGFKIGFVANRFSCCHNSFPFAIDSFSERSKQRANVTFYLAGYHYTIRPNHNST